MTPTTSRVRWSGSFLLLVAAAAHIPLVREHLEEAPYVGWLFLLLSVVYILLAIAILLVDRSRVWRVSGLTCTLALAAFLASRTIGLPQIGDEVGNWTEPLSLPAIASEVLMAALTAWHLRRSHGEPARRQSPATTR